MESIQNNSELWNKEIDTFLRTLISLYGTKDWPRIADIMTESGLSYRTAQQCKDRWHQLSFNDSKESWSEREGLELLRAHKKYENKWTEIAQALNGRSSNSVKNRFYSIFRKIKNKIIRKDFAYNSKLELVEAFYSISLMQEYYKRPTPIKERGGKRGKDFIFSLLKELSLPEVTKYKAELLNLGNKEITLEELRKEMDDKKITDNLAKPEDKTIQPVSPFSTIKSLFYKGDHWELPSLRPSSSITTLTSQEKVFMQNQFFQTKDLFSAGFLTANSLPLSSTVKTMLLFSAEAPSLTTKKFDGFSDYTKIAKNKRLI